VAKTVRELAASVSREAPSRVLLRSYALPPGPE
jgi:hypothetical protein